MGHLLGVDAGTTALKVGVFDAVGATLAVAVEEYALRTPAPDRAELDPGTYWDALVAAGRRAIERAGIRGQDVSAIGVSSQGETVVPVDAVGSPIGPAIVWLDNRATREAAELEAAFDAAEVYAATGVPAINPTWTAAKLLWLRRHDPATFGAAARFLLVEDLVVHGLTGRFVTEGGVQCTTLLFDIRQHGWWQPMLDRLELGRDRLPELVPPGTAVGTLRAEAAAALGLPRSVTVVAAGMDQAAGAIGVGNLAPGIVSESTGGALTLQASIDRPDGDRSRRTPVYVHSVPGRYLYCPVCPTGGMALTWFRDRFGDAEVARAAAEGRSAYDLLTAARRGRACRRRRPDHAAPPDGRVQPRVRAARPRRVVYGFTLAHGKGHFVRAILEADRVHAAAQPRAARGRRRRGGRDPVARRRGTERPVVPDQGRRVRHPGGYPQRR